MKIAIEAQRAFRPHKHGMDVAVLELIRNLQEMDHENEYFVIVKPDRDKCLEETKNFKIIEVPARSYPMWEQFALPKAAKDLNCELLHCTSNTGPIRSSLPVMLTLHDMIYLEGGLIALVQAKGTDYQRYGNVYRRFVVPRFVKKCSRVITVSQSEKERLANFFDLPDEKLRYVYNGVSNHFKTVDSYEELERIKSQYNLPDEYVFFLGNTVAKKNTPGTLKAFALFRKKSGIDIPMVMPDFNEKDLRKILREIGEEDLRDQIHLTGYIVNTDLPGIYQNASVYLYTSYRESFGIPILEGQMCSTPVITSNTSSMPEVARDGAIIVDPYNSDEIADAITKVMQDEKLRKDLVSKGLENAKRFSWKNMAKETLAIYRELGAH